MTLYNFGLLLLLIYCTTCYFCCVRAAWSLRAFAKVKGKHITIGTWLSILGTSLVAPIFVPWVLFVLGPRKGWDKK